MKITFIEPKNYYKHIYSKFTKHLPLLGPIYLGTILKQRGHQVEILNENMTEINPKKINSDIVCFSTLTSTAKRGYHLADQLRNKAKIIFGGSHASFNTQEALQHADQVVVGEAEPVIADIVEGKNKNKVVQGQRIENLDSLPLPDFSMVKDMKKNKIRPVTTSRGCPFGCNFCSVTRMFGRKYRFRSPENIVREIKNTGRRTIFFYDDNFAALKSRSKEIIRNMIKKCDYRRWTTQVRTDVAKDPELLKLMNKSNCSFLYIGLESINPKTLKSYNKQQSVKDIKYCIKKLHDYNINVHGMFMFGSDMDSKKTIRKTTEFANHMEIDTVQFSVQTPLPGTPLYNNLVQQKRIFTYNWSLYDSHHVVYQPKKMSAYDLQLHTFQALKDFYSYSNSAKMFLKGLFENSAINLFGHHLVKTWARQNERYLEFLARLKKKYSPKIIPQPF